MPPAAEHTFSLSRNWVISLKVQGAYLCTALAFPFCSAGVYVLLMIGGAPALNGVAGIAGVGRRLSGDASHRPSTAPSTKASYLVANLLASLSFDAGLRGVIRSYPGISYVT